MMLILSRDKKIFPDKNTIDFYIKKPCAETQGK